MNHLAILVLEDGTIFKGVSVGAQGIAVGELIFNTSMTGYQEIMSDPSYAKQLIVFTTPHIGNVGINKEDFESNQVWAAGIIMRQLTSITSNWRSVQTFADYLKQNNIIAISNIDTRKLTHKLRQQGALKACIMSGEYDQNLALTYAQKFEGIEGRDLSSLASTLHSYEYTKKPSQYHIIVYDFGVKSSILQALAHYGCSVTVVPSNTSVEAVLKLSPDGIMLSNGPGDPRACQNVIETIRLLLKTNIPLLGICLGYQLLALALGAVCSKMRFGHHGANHPVQDLMTGKIMITSQNHGFMVEEDSLPDTLRPTHRSLFDGSLQGITNRDRTILGFQGHPEAGPGPHDALPLFTTFIDAMKIYQDHIKHAESIYA